MTSVSAPEPQPPARTFLCHWQQLNNWLADYRPLWQPVPFTEPEPDWKSGYPALWQWLDTLSDDACDGFEQSLDQFARRVAAFEPGLGHYTALVTVPELLPAGAGPQTALPESRAVDMPGRKRLQAGAFTAAILPLEHPLLDWCCGKGHLARTLACQGDVEVLGFEWNSALVQDGNRLAGRYDDPVHLCRQDVMSAQLGWPRQPRHGVALHACGDLHRRLMQLSTEARAPRLSFSPCCYHQTSQDRYRLMAHATGTDARALELDRSILRLAVQETVTAPARERRQGVRLRTWRLGFDALQRHLRGVDEYLPVPSHPPALNSGDFEGFCRWAAQRRHLVLPEGLHWPYWLKRGDERARQVRRHELLRHLFRRPLELWMVLDYAVFLEEQGYRVRLGTFCERQLTPRNLLLDAVRRPA
ncbi:MAG TPA: methyltransferase [Marinobacter sp.]|nr:methyltransferase [Marinobacter sp.]